MSFADAATDLLCSYVPVVVRFPAGSPVPCPNDKQGREYEQSIDSHLRYPCVGTKVIHSQNYV